MTTREIAEILDMTPRNVKAYIEYLKMAGVPVQGMTGRSGGYYLGEAYSFDVPKLDEGECSALLLAQKLLTRENGFPLEKELQTAVAKVRTAIGDTVSQVFPLPADELIFTLGKTEQRDNINQIFARIYMAIKQRRRLQMLYYTPTRDERTQREVDPYAVVHREGSWYLIGYCHLRGEIRTFKLARIERIEISEACFEYPLNFNVKEYMKNIFTVIQGEEHNVEIVFFHPASVWVKEKIWLPSQQIKELKDGSVIFKARVKGLIDIKRWVLSFGKLAKVKKPKELVESIQKELNDMEELYGED
jgi:predicted DNA-binding transcriptional regulator YafY